MHCSPFGTQSPQFFIIVCVYAVKKREKWGRRSQGSVDRMKAKEWKETSPFDMFLRKRKKSRQLIPKVYWMQARAEGVWTARSPMKM